MKAISPQTGQQQSGGTLKSMKDKLGHTEKDLQEGPVLKTAGPEGEITAGLCRYSTLNNCINHDAYPLCGSAEYVLSITKMPEVNP